MTTSTHKRGDTFDYSDQLVMTVDGAAVTNFDGMTGASQIRDASDNLIAALEFTWLDPLQGLYRVRHAGSTAVWPLGQLFHDVQLTTPGGEVVSTATEIFKLVKDVTHG